MTNAHVIEIEPRRARGSGGYVCGRMIVAATTRSDTEAAVRGAVEHATQRAHALLAEREDIDLVGLYHSYPSPGPQRRYVAAIGRDA